MNLPFTSMMGEGSISSLIGRLMTIGSIGVFNNIVQYPAGGSGYEDVLQAATTLAHRPVLKYSGAVFIKRAPGLNGIATHSFVLVLRNGHYLRFGLIMDGGPMSSLERSQSVTVVVGVIDTVAPHITTLPMAISREQPCVTHYEVLHHFIHQLFPMTIGGTYSQKEQVHSLVERLKQSTGLTAPLWRFLNALNGLYAEPDDQGSDISKMMAAGEGLVSVVHEAMTVTMAGIEKLNDRRFSLLLTASRRVKDPEQWGGWLVSAGLDNVWADPKRLTAAVKKIVYTIDSYIGKVKVSDLPDGLKHLAIYFEYRAKLIESIDTGEIVFDEKAVVQQAFSVIQKLDQMAANIGYVRPAATAKSVKS